ncbi:MAG: hypothetical protein KatS3mg004_0830 [Bryobacteraceae bacterium]|nr:MAG: hypothetical protein KatS3mg004_0830 [Bryobacteraceae bacterium]
MSGNTPAADWIGWAATAVFAASYLARDPRRLRLVQAAAAVMWILYGVLMKAAPVVAANVAVAAIALFSLWHGRGRPSAGL